MLLTLVGWIAACLVLALVVVGIRGSNPMIKLKNAEVNISVMAVRCKSDLRVAIAGQAAAEGISASDVIRRATIRDLRFLRKEPDNAA